MAVDIQETDPPHDLYNALLGISEAIASHREFDRLFAELAHWRFADDAVKLSRRPAAKGS